MPAHLPAAFAVVLLLAGCLAPAPRTEPLAGGTLRPGTLPGTLREAAERAGIAIGAFVGFNWTLADRGADPAEWALAAREFDSLTAAGLFMQEVHPERDRYDFAPADALVAFAEQHGMRVRGQHVVFHYFLPDWLGWRCDRPPHWFQLPLWWKVPDPLPPSDPCVKCTDPQGQPWTRDALAAVLRDHVRTVLAHFGDRVDTWDVVHEPVSDQGDRLRATCWYQVLGEDYLDLAYRAARDAAPHARLFLTEYGAEAPGAKADALFDLVQRLQARSVPLDGVSFQGLFFVEDPATFPTRAELVGNLQRFAALGLDVEVSELNIGLRLDPAKGDTYAPSAEQLAIQRQQFEDVVAACLAVPRCTRVTVNGVDDANNWRWPDKPLLFDEQLRAKPARDGVLAALRAAAARGGP
jgi:endo-1,4-beta-xylanase